MLLIWRRTYFLSVFRVSRVIGYIFCCLRVYIGLNSCGAFCLEGAFFSTLVYVATLVCSAGVCSIHHRRFLWRFGSFRLGLLRSGYGALRRGRVYMFIRYGAQRRVDLSGCRAATIWVESTNYAGTYRADLANDIYFAYYERVIVTSYRRLLTVVPNVLRSRPRRVIVGRLIYFSYRRSSASF